MRPDASSSIKHIWLRAIGGFGFLIHSNFLVEVVVVLRAVGGGGGGYCCGFLGLPLVVVELGFNVARFEEQKRKGTRVATIFLCVVLVGGGGGQLFWQKVKLKTEIHD